MPQSVHPAWSSTRLARPLSRNDPLVTLVRFGLGEKAVDGRHYVSWIYDTDFAQAVLWIINREDIRGAVNLAAPNTLPNAAFLSDLRAA